MLKLRKTLRTYKDYGNNFYKVQSKAFINYILIMVSLFGVTAPHLQAALTYFYGLILQLSKVYDWKKARLPLAIKVYSHIVTQQLSNRKQQVIPPKFQGRFCTPTTVICISSLLGSSAKRKLSKSPPHQSARTIGFGFNNPTVNCNSFNKDLCTWERCERQYKCRRYGSKDHGLDECKKK